MDEIAERGMASHWKYKGLKAESSFEDWLSTLRESLENADANEESKLEDFKLNLYDDEIFVFTPKGDLKSYLRAQLFSILHFQFIQKLGLLVFLAR